MLLERFLEILLEKCQLDKKRLVIVGVSGGPDSICLLDLFDRLKWKILVAHFNHKLRPESDLDQQFVKNICSERGIPFVSRSIKIGSLARASKRSIEEEARYNRYHFLFEQAQKHRAFAVAVGHNADDQVETVLMHFIRGSGLTGLRGMTYRSIPNEWNTEIPLVRPLLGFWRQEIEEYCIHQQLKTISDSTNRENLFFRNRLRNELVPFLETFNLKVKQRILATAEIARGDLEVTSGLTSKTWDLCTVSISKQLVVIDRKNFNDQPVGLKRALVNKIIGQLNPTARDIGFLQIQQAIQFAQNGTRSGEMQWFDDLQIVVEGDRIFFGKTGKKLPVNDFPQIEHEQLIRGSEKSIKLNDRWKLTIEKLEQSPSSLKSGQPFVAYLDADSIQFPLALKHWRQGDRIAPLGMVGKTIKISDIWTRMKIPNRARQHFPVLWDKSRIIWLPGFRQADSVKIKPSTVHFLKIWISRD